MSQPLTVLHVEDDFADAILLQHALCDGGAFDIDLEVVRTLREARRKLTKRSYDLIIADLRLPDSTNPNETVSLLRKDATETQILVLTGSAGVDAEKVGAGVTVLDKNAFFHNRDDRKSRALVRRVLEACEPDADEDDDALML
ncbi:MAG: response regulator [Oceanicaulis sp.]